MKLLEISSNTSYKYFGTNRVSIERLGNCNYIIKYEQKYEQNDNLPEKKHIYKAYLVQLTFTPSSTISPEMTEKLMTAIGTELEGLKWSATEKANKITNEILTAYGIIMLHAKEGNKGKIDAYSELEDNDLEDYYDYFK